MMRVLMMSMLMVRMLMMRVLKAPLTPFGTSVLEDEWKLVGNEDTWLDTMGAAELRPAAGNRCHSK
jgi:hypothetical protein